MATTRMIREGNSWSGREKHCAFLNTGDRRFADVSAASGLDFPDDGRAAAVVDWDLDGDLDLWISNRTAPRLRFMRNDAARGAGFVALRLEDRGANRDAIGARVELTLAGGRKLVRSLRAGEGFLAQSSKWLHFGLGRAERIEGIVVRWPGGEREAFDGVAPGGRWVLARGAGSARAWSAPRGEPPRFAASAPASPAPTAKARVVLASTPPMPALRYADFDGAEASLEALAGRPYLLNLWASWCAPCLEELRAFERHAGELDRAGLAVLALSADPPESRAQARAFVEGLGGGLVAGVASEELCELLDVLQKTLLDKRERIPIPTSFLVDARGRLLTLYKGAVEVRQVLDDLALADLTAEARRDAAVPFPGRWHGPPPFPALAELAAAFSSAGHPELAQSLLDRAGGAIAGGALQAEATAASVQYDLGVSLARAGRAAEAQAAFGQSVELYRRALERQPDDPRLLLNLGVALKSARRWAEASEVLGRALDGHPDPPRVHANLAECASALGRHDRAIGHLREAVRLAPADTSLAAALAAYLAHVGQLDEAERLVSDVLGRSPAEPRAWMTRGAIALGRGRAEDAAAAYRRALEAEPSNLEALDGLLRSLVAAGRRDEALERLAELERVDAAGAARLRQRLGDPR